MYRISEDVEAELQKKFPSVHIPTVIHHLFQAILEKSLRDAACSIREFGKFLTFKTKSNRTGQDVIRIKFKISVSLSNKLKTDKYLLDNIPIKAPNVFSDVHEEKTKDKQLQKLANVEAQKEAERLGKEKTKGNLVTNEIIDIMNSIVNENRGE